MMDTANDENPQYRLIVLGLHKDGYYSQNPVKPFDMQWADKASKPLLYNTLDCYGPYDRLREAKAQFTRAARWSRAAEIHGIIQICEPIVWNSINRLEPKP